MSLPGTSFKLIASRNRWPDDVSVWLIDAILHERALHDVLTTLSDDERDRAARFHKYEDRSRFAATRACLRSLLAERVGTSARAIAFDLGPNGRPSLNGFPGVSFNVTHAGSFAMIAVSEKRTVGIDIERLDAVPDWMSLAGHVCSLLEIATIEAAPSNQRHGLFMRCWTAKEALLKTTGSGIGDLLKQVAVDPSIEVTQYVKVVDPLSIGTGPLAFHWIDDFLEYCACVAYSGD